MLVANIKKRKATKNQRRLGLDYLNLKISLILAILVFMSNLNFMIKCVDYENKLFYNLRAWFPAIKVRHKLVCSAAVAG